MKAMVVIRVGALSALALTSSLQAHHSGSMYSTSPVRVEGTVIRFEPINPHTLMTIEARSADGQLRRWVVEGPGQSQLDRIGPGREAPNVGDTVRFCAFPYRPAEELARLFPEASFSTPRFAADADGTLPRYVAGHVMQIGDGDRQLWEPHGTISECIRSSDEDRQVWLNFIDTGAESTVDEAIVVCSPGGIISSL